MIIKRQLSRRVFGIWLAVCLEGAHGLNAAPTSAQTTIDQAINRHTLSFFKAQPLLSTQLDVEENKVGGKYNNRLPDFSSKGMQQLQSSMRQAINELSAIDTKALENKDRSHLNIVKAIEAHYAGSQVFTAGYIDTWGGHLPYIVNQISGPLIDTPKAMQVQQRINSIEDAQNYLDRLQSFALFTEQVLEKVKADEQAGVILPKKLFPKTLIFFRNFLSSPPEQHALVTTFEERLNKIDNISAQKKQLLVAEASKRVRKVVYKGYQKIFEFMKLQFARAPANDGIWAQPNGGLFYTHAIRHLADSELDADTIHSIGLMEVTRISAEMDQTLKTQGYTKGSVGERMIRLNNNPTFLYEDSDAGRANLIEDLNKQIKAVMDKAPEMFATLPEADIEVRRISTTSEAGEAGGFYSAPSLDGSRPGIYWINLRNIKANPSFSLKTLTYHEAVPGHHFQIALNMAQQDIGLLRQNAPFNTYVEGWALYSEQLAEEMGMYKNDPWGNLGRLQAELYRAVRLVVDTGLHSKKWTREKAIDYFYNTTGNPKSDVIAEVERYLAWPGQALGYKLGMLQFLDLRQWARRELRDQFDIKQFHDVLLLPGAQPMMLVKQNVEAWVKRKKQSR